jgi:hypothetical protein
MCKKIVFFGRFGTGGVAFCGLDDVVMVVVVYLR